MNSTSNKKMIYRSLFIGACAILCFAIVAQAQYNTFDSDSNSDSDGNPILTQAELGKLVRNSAKAHAQQNQYRNQQQQNSAATRNLYNRQQPMQFDQSQYRQQSRNYGDSSALNGFGPVMGAASNGRGASSEANDDDEGASTSSLGSNFGSNLDNNNNNNDDSDGEVSSANSAGDALGLNLNQAASGYPAQDYNNDASLFGFGPGYSTPDAEFAGNENFGNGEGRREKSASSHPGSSRGLAGEEDAGAPQYGPNSAINGDKEDDERSSYAPEGDNDNDDE